MVLLAEPPLSPLGVWIAQHVALLVQLTAGGGALGLAWRATKKYGAAAACTTVHIGIAHSAERFDDAVFGVLERDSRAPEPRLYPINNKVHARDLAARTAAINESREATESLDRKVDALSGVIVNGMDRSREATERLTTSMDRTNETLMQHGIAQATTATKLQALAEKVDDWDKRERRVAPDPKKPRSRGGQRTTDPS